MPDRRAIIIDTDPGQDDALAILLALASPELDLAAVTTIAAVGPTLCHELLSPHANAAVPSVSG